MLSDICSYSNRLCVVDYLVNLVLDMIHVDDGQLRCLPFTISISLSSPALRLQVEGLRLPLTSVEIDATVL